MTAGSDRVHRTATCAVALLVGAVVQVGALLNWSTDLDRTANPLGYASNFFDFQARALMDGHLWVAPGSLGIEAFQVDGREYMYFGPFPALLRIPVLWTTSEFDGRLTVVSMLLAYAIFATMTTRLLWLVRDVVRGSGEPVTGREGAVLGTVLALCLAGTSLTYNASLPWVYHEVYAWAVALALGCAYWMVRVQIDPRRWTIGWLIAFDLALVLTRTPGGFAVCLGTVAIGVWWASGRGTRPLRRVGAVLVAGGLACLGAGVAVNMAKFGHPFLFPLEDQVWTQLNEHRREALAANGGTITGPQFFTTGLLTYFRLDGIRFVDYFPWVTFPAEPARAVGSAFIDQSYRTGSVTAFMPLLLIMALASVPWLMRTSAKPRTLVLWVPVLSMVLVTGAIMNYGYYAYRYTGDIVPALVVGSVVTGVLLARVLQRVRASVVTASVTLLALGTAYSTGAHLLVGFQAAAFTSPGPALARYLATQEDISPGAQARLTTVGQGPPSERGAPDAIHVQGSCDALYVETGEDADRWLLAERRSVVVTARLDPDFTASSSIIVTIGTEPRRWIRLQTNDDGQARVVLQHEEDPWYGPWFDVLPPYEIRIGVRDLPEWGYAEVGSNPGGYVGFTRSFSWSEDWVRQPIPIEVTVDDTADLAERGIHVEPEAGVTPPTCRRILGDYSAHE
ncbi:MAG: hypothetical protein JWN97_1179 [Nocardioides sp.]|nr:hypothetical protein [Nocardioides sp.]